MLYRTQKVDYRSHNQSNLEYCRGIDLIPCCHVDQLSAADVVRRVLTICTVPPHITQYCGRTHMVRLGVQLINRYEFYSLNSVVLQRIPALALSQYFERQEERGQRNKRASSSGRYPLCQPAHPFPFYALEHYWSTVVPHALPNWFSSG